MYPKMMHPKKTAVFSRFLTWCGLAVIMAAGCGKGFGAALLSSNGKPAGKQVSRPASPGASAAAQQNPARPKDWGVAEEFDFDWQGNGQPAHFKIEQSMDEQISRLTISIKGQRDWVLENDDVWEEFARDFLKEEDFPKKNRNLAASKYVFSLAPSPSARPWVFLVTPQYASDPGNLWVLALDSSGRPEIILKTTLHIKEFRDLDGDGVAEIAGLPCFSQSWSANLLTYDPLHVYKLETTPKPELKLSLPLSQDYNLKHYYGWAGPDCSEDLAVVLHPPGGGKPVIMKTEEAKKMLGKKK
jgi:hypothetical protein